MTEKPSILDALAIWSHWHGDCSPLGCTGTYALDMQLADAFRALLYRPALNDRLNWLFDEVGAAQRRKDDSRYCTELVSWWLSIFEAEKAEIIENRTIERNGLCASS